MATNLKFTLMGVVIDIISLVLVFMPTVVFELSHVKPVQRGFYCNDDSIKYPYHPNTVPVWIVFVVGIIVPIIFFCGAEACRYHTLQSTVGNRPPGYRLTTSCSVPSFIIITYRITLAFLFGLAVTQSITDICKYSIGRLRPHFLDVCRPNVTCDGSILSYVDDFTCTGPPGYALNDSRLSFLSGHTSISYFCAVYFALYLQARFTWKGSKLLKHLLQAVAIYAAVYVGLSRISDYKHHWSDVLMGAVLGSFVASLVSIYTLKVFQLDYSRSNSSIVNNCNVTIENRSNSVMLDINNAESGSIPATQYMVT